MASFRVMSLGFLPLLLACGTAPVDEASSKSELSTDSSWVGDEGAPECNRMFIQFSGTALFHDLEKTLAPGFSSAGRVFVPKAITATDDTPFTSVLTVLAAQMLLPDSGDGLTSPVAQISGEVPDSLDGDRAAHALYDAMTRGVSKNDDAQRVSQDGLFECHIESWKGGDLYVCTFQTVVAMRGVSWPSRLCSE
jgi:hypothetical protein